MRKYDKNNNNFIDFLELWSFNAIYNFVDTVRNTGKTTKCKAWAIARYLKHGKQTLWVRAFEDDIMRLYTLIEDGKKSSKEAKEIAKVLNGYVLPGNDPILKLLDLMKDA